jgi:predicted membrane protein
MEKLGGKTILGLLLVIVGGLWVLDNFNFGFLSIPFHDLIFSWHTFFVIAGAIIISNSKNSFWGFLLLFIGIIGWLRHFPYLPFRELLNLGDLWPLLLLAFGLWLIFRRNENNHHKYEHYQKEFQNSVHGEAEKFAQAATENYSNYSLDVVDENAAFTSSKKIITSQNFRGGKVSAAFGHVELDFRQAKLAPGEHKLEISAVFGAVELHLPQDWKVIVNVSAVFGGFDDKRYVNPSATQNSDSTLIINGSVVLGGGELTN